jgi:long-chain acyl-CoA synthetase
MTQAWFKNYPKNVAHQIDLDKAHSLLDLFNQSVERYHDKIAFSNFGAELSFSDVDRLSNDFAAYLQSKLKISKGDHVALMSPNILSFPVAMWGIIKVGGVQVNVNPLYTSKELQHQLNDAQVKTIIIFSPSTKVLADIVDNTQVTNVIVIELDDLVAKGLPNTPVDKRLKKTIHFLEVLKQGQAMAFNSVELCAKDLLFLQYTGGTTGLSKGAMLSHGNIVANVLQYQEFAKDKVMHGNEVVITAIPMYHIFALTANALCYFFFGAKNILVTNPRDMVSFVKVWQDNKATFFTGVNTLFNGLLHTPGFDRVDFSDLKLTIGGGAAVQAAVAKKWQQVTGNQLNEGYGLSETSPILTLNFGDRSHTEGFYIAGVGSAIPSTDISIRDDNGLAVKPGQAGELCAKGPQIMLGYWNNEEATVDAMTMDGYFKTGDVALLDEHGFFHIVDRKKDMIIVSGFNVYPNEIEAEIAHMPGVLESACIGIEDQKTGEAVKVFAVKESNEQGQGITENAIIDFCRQSLAGYKVPKEVEFIDELPKSSVGKILRRELK